MRYVKGQAFTRNLGFLTTFYSDGSATRRSVHIGEPMLGVYQFLRRHRWTPRLYLDMVPGDLIEGEKERWYRGERDTWWNK